MIDLSTITDRYSRQARLVPALLVLLPLLLALLAWFPEILVTSKGLLSLAIACGVLLFLSELGRDRGKKLEAELFKSWGGKPSIALLRWRDERIDRFTKEGYHAFLAGAVPTTRFPTPK